MAAEEVEYESDPEEAKLSLKMRRREASDDEEEAEQGGKPPRRIESDGESEGAAAEYEEELDEEEEDYDLDDEEEIEGVAVQCEEGGGGRGKDVAEVVAVERGESERERNFEGNDDAGENNDGDKNAVDGEHEEEKKEVEPFSVPTAGAFYMHDDRFRDNAGGRNRYWTESSS